MRAVGYIRVSTDEQVNGPKAQADALAAWCARNGVELVAVHHDHGVSGGAELDKRPGLLAALDELERGDVLLVAKRDRLARSVAPVRHGRPPGGAHGRAGGVGRWRW